MCALLRLVTGLLLAASPAFTACVQPGRRFGPDGPLPEVRWTEAEEVSEIAARPVTEREGLRVVLVRLSGTETPHTHPEDLTVFILEGQALMHFGERAFPVEVGDVIEIPAGVEHWAERTSRQPALAYAIFTASAPRR